MASLTPGRDSARAELLDHLDYYVESFTVHTCRRLDDVEWLLKTARRDGLWLLCAWVDSGKRGAYDA